MKREKRINKYNALKSLNHELNAEKDPNGSVWELTLCHYRFPFIEVNKQLNDIKYIDELNEIKSNYEQVIATAPKKGLNIKVSFMENQIKKCLKKRKKKRKQLKY